jgi:hypothetical protein
MKVDPDQLADPVVPTDRWEQDVPAGGADVEGGVPRAALAVAPIGITDIRITPALDAASGQLSLAIGQSSQLVGRTPQRRRILVGGTVAFTLCVTPQQAAAGGGLPVPANTIVTLTTAAPLWVQCGAAAGLVGFVAELDQG